LQNGADITCSSVNADADADTGRMATRTSTDFMAPL
jgi:hypothetical protein